MNTTASSFQEFGFYVLIDSRKVGGKEGYSTTPLVTGKAFNYQPGNLGATISLGTKPGDISPTSFNGGKFTIASFHTHPVYSKLPKNIYQATNQYTIVDGKRVYKLGPDLTGFRDVGFSILDKQTDDVSNVAGLVYDYIGETFKSLTKPTTTVTGANYINRLNHTKIDASAKVYTRGRRKL